MQAGESAKHGLNGTSPMKEREREGRKRERERTNFGTWRKPLDDESNAVDRSPGARETSLTRGRRWIQTRGGRARERGDRSRLESEWEGCFRAGRYSRKSRERAEWRENSRG